jgi:ACS family tartrate transporter-like MFS transporter
VQAMGFSNFATSVIVALPFVGAIVAMILWGRSSDRRGELIWHTALPLLVAGLGFTGASWGESDWLTLMALSLAVVGIYPSLSPLISLPSSFLGGAAGAGGTALVYAIGGLGAFLGPAIIGTLKEETGGYAAGMAALAVGVVLAALIALAAGRAMATGPMIIRSKAGKRS